ncbi:MAG: hypothetical protein SFU98_10390 [Leptospiraceae bacterium]|nr:hypothetical protein [Leptospiraceae bacterium]
MEVYKDLEFYKLFYDKSTNIGKGVWNHFTTHENHVIAGNAVLDFIREKKLKKWIGNSLNIGVVPQASNEYWQKEWFPKALELGIRYIGYIAPEKEIAKMSSQQITQTFESGLVVKTIESEEKAFEWLKTL